MPEWIPVNNVFDSSTAIENVLGFIETYQTDALAWAVGEGGDVLEEIKVFNNSVRNVTIFPALTILNSSESEGWEDINDADFTISMVVDIQGGDMNKVSQDARKYALALKSLLANMLETTLFQNSIIVMTATIKQIQVEYDFLAKQNHQFIQSFEIQAVWECSLAAR